MASENAVKIPSFARLCDVCHGRGEVEAGITGGFRCTGHNEEDGQMLGYPTQVVPNPRALIEVERGVLDVCIVQENPEVPLWGIAICGTCHGTGLVSLDGLPHSC